MGTLETVRCYNPGPRIVDKFYYSIIPPDKDLNNVSWWDMDVPRDSFFEIPREVEILSRVYTLPLKSDVLRRYEIRGIIAIEPNIKPEAEQEIIKGAKAKFTVYCEEMVKKHFEQCLQCRMNNMPPVPATGFTKTAIELLGASDPADAYSMALKGQGDPKFVREVKEMQENFERDMGGLRAQIQQLTIAAGNKKDPRNRAEDTNMGLEPGKNDAKANPGEGDAPAGDRKGRARR